jgi:hypothetical protein
MGKNQSALGNLFPIIEPRAVLKSPETLLRKNTSRLLPNSRRMSKQRIFDSLNHGFFKNMQAYRFSKEERRHYESEGVSGLLPG